MGLKEDLARMEAEDRAATPGPWTENDYGTDTIEVVSGDIWICDSARIPIRAGDAPEANRQFIKSSRTDRPALARFADLAAQVLVGSGAMDEVGINALWTEAQRKK